MIDVHTINQKKKYIDSYKRKKMIDVHAVKKKKKTNKESIQILTIGKKKMIDVHTVNQKKQRKYIDSYNTNEKKND